MTWRAGRRVAAMALAALVLCGVVTGCAAPEARGAVGQPLLEWWGNISGGLLTPGAGQPASGYVNLVQPTAVAARGNYVFVVDAGARRLYRYNRATQRLTGFAGLSPVAGWGIYAAPDMSLYVSDPAARRISHYSWDGRLINVFSDDVNLGRPAAFAVDGETGAVLVADALYHRIVVFNSLGRALYIIRPCAAQAVGMDSLTAMALTRDQIYLVDRIAKRVVVQQRHGAVCRVLGEDSLVDPSAIAVDRSGRVYVSDNYDDTIKIFSPSGQSLGEYGGSGAGPHHFNHITGLWIDGNTLYVADSLNGRIQMLLITPRPAQGRG